MRNLQKRDAARSVVMQACPLLIIIYADMFGIKIVQGGTEASTNGGMINLPGIPDDYPYPSAIYGFLAHEAAHIRFTRFQIFAAIKNPLLFRITNALEDGRCEILMISDFPGTESTIAQATRLYVEIGKMPIPDEKMDQGNAAIVLQAFLLYWMRHVWRQQAELAPHFEAANRRLNEVFPKPLVVKLNALLREAPACRSTQNIASLSERILSMVKDELEKPEESSEKSQGSQNGGPSDDQEESNGASGNGDPNDASSGKDQSDLSAQDTAQGQSTDDQSNQTDDASGQSPTGSRNQQLLDQILDASSASSAGSGDVTKDVFDGIRDMLEAAARENPDHNDRCIPSKAINPPEGLKPDPEMVKLADMTSIQLRAQLTALIQSRQRKLVSHDVRGRRIDSRRLAGVFTGHYDIFLKEEVRELPNTAVHLLIDASWSMADRVDPRDPQSPKLMDIANQAGYALALALSRIKGANPAVTYFSGSGQTVTTALRHGQSFALANGLLAQRPSGGTPMAQAMWYCVEALASTRESRRMLIVITDGDPDQVAPVMRVNRLAMRAGIDVLGVGINSSSVIDLFKDSVVITDVRQLRSKLFELVGHRIAAA